MDFIKIAEKYKALIFDCDGTLVDNMHYHYESWHMAMADCGHQVSDEELLNYRGWSTEAIVRDLNDRHSLAIDPVKFSVRKEEAFYEIATHLPEISPVADVARAYHGQKHMAVISGGIFSNVKHSLSAIGLYELFPIIIGADNAHGLPPKPSPDAFIYVANYYNVAPQDCLVFEDGDSGIIAGKAAGMDTVDVRPYL